MLLLARVLLVALTAAHLAAPLSVDAQPLTAVPRLGLLGDATSWDAFRFGLRDLGYAEGKSVALEERSSQGRNERFPELASELVRRDVNVIITWGTPATLAAKQATKTIPIVMTHVGDPVRSGLVASLAHPGGNVTGVTALGPGVAAKRLELLKDAVPNVALIAFLWNPGNPDQKRLSVRFRRARGPWA